MLTWPEMGAPLNLLDFLFAILQENRITIDNGVAKLSPFLQTTDLVKDHNSASVLLIAKGSAGPIQRNLEASQCNPVCRRLCH